MSRSPPKPIAQCCSRHISFTAAPERAVATEHRSKKSEERSTCPSRVKDMNGLHVGDGYMRTVLRTVCQTMIEMTHVHKPHMHKRTLTHVHTHACTHQHTCAHHTHTLSLSLCLKSKKEEQASHTIVSCPFIFLFYM